MIVLFVLWQLFGTGLVEQHAQQRLAHSFTAATQFPRVEHAEHDPAPHVGRASSGVVAQRSSGGRAERGSVVGRLQIPAIGLDQFVVQGTSENQLAEGPGHYEQTALPGAAGNVAIAGHRTTFGAPFNRLGAVIPGDLIYLTDAAGERLEYRVDAQPVSVLPSDVAVLSDFGDNRITLTTCTPEFSRASASSSPVSSSCRVRGEGAHRCVSPGALP